MTMATGEKTGENKVRRARSKFRKEGSTTDSLVSLGAHSSSSSSSPLPRPNARARRCVVPCQDVRGCPMGTRMPSHLVRAQQRHPARHFAARCHVCAPRVRARTGRRARRGAQRGLGRLACAGAVDCARGIRALGLGGATRDRACHLAEPYRLVVVLELELAFAPGDLRLSRGHRSGPRSHRPRRLCGYGVRALAGGERRVRRLCQRDCANARRHDARSSRGGRDELHRRGHAHARAIAAAV